MHQASARALHDEDEYTSPPPTRRRTVTVTGHPHRAHVVRRSARVVEIDRRRPRRPIQPQVGPRPDRVALWALFMAVLLVVVTALSSHM
jgi:hypothetical protein